MITPFNPVLKDGIVYHDQWELADREKVIAEARTWIGTPYHTNARVKGAGCDCATLLFMVYHACGLVPDEDTGIFSGDWWCHVSDEIYMRRVVRHAHKVAEAISYATLSAKPGNIVLTRCAESRVYNHAGIVTAWPKLIHAMDPAVEEVDATQHWAWNFRTVTVLDPWEKQHDRG